MDGKHIVFEGDLPVFCLPVPHLATVLIRYSKRFDGIKVIEGLHLECHHLAGHLPNLFLIIPLLADQEFGHEHHKRRGGKGDQGHDRIVMPEDQKCSQEVVGGDHDGRKPADGIAADGADIAVEAVHDVAVGVPAHGQPVGINDLIKDICLNIIIDINAQLGRDPADDTLECQTEYRAAHHDGKHQGQLVCLIAGNDIDQIFTGYAGNQPKGGADDSQQGIEGDCSFVFGTIRKNPLPVVKDFSEGAVFNAAEQSIQRSESGISVFFVL